MDRNLGASQVATSSDDSSSYGDLYQWGRYSDGHEKRNSLVFMNKATTPTPNDGNLWDASFITAGNAADSDWLTPSNNNLWQGVDGVNNPCASGYRIPTYLELNNERMSWTSNDLDGAFNSVLKIASGGVRERSDGTVNGEGYTGVLWSSTTNSSYSYCLFFNANNAFNNTGGRADGFSIRCIKD